MELSNRMIRTASHEGLADSRGRLLNIMGVGYGWSRLGGRGAPSLSRFPRYDGWALTQDSSIRQLQDEPVQQMLEDRSF